MKVIIITIITLTFVQQLIGAKLGFQIDAFVEDLGPYEETTEFFSAIQYVWKSGSYEIVLNIANDLSLASVQLIDDNPERMKSVAEIKALAQAWLPSERFAALSWDDPKWTYGSDGTEFTVWDLDKNTMVYNRWNSIVKTSQYILYVKNLKSIPNANWK